MADGLLTPPMPQRRAKRQLRVFHNSEYGLWLDCHQAWWFAYAEQLDTEPEAFYLRFGTAFHAGVEAAWRLFAADGTTDLSGTALEAAARSTQEFLAKLQPSAEEARAEAEDGWVTLRWSIPHYLECIKDDFRRYEPVWIEQPFRAAVLDTGGRARHLYQEGAVDLLLFDTAANQLVLREQKTTGGNVQSFEGKLSIDPQMTGYLEGVFARRPETTLRGTPIPPGAPLGRVQYDVIRSKAPTEPSVNKVKKNDGVHTVTAALAVTELESGKSQGMVSRAKIDTTAEIYSAALCAQNDRGLATTDEQRELLRELLIHGDTYYHRFEYNRFSQSEVSRWRREVWAETKQMEMVRSGALPPTRNQHYCTGVMARPCKFKAVCQQDTPETRALYVRKEDHELHGPQRGVTRGSESAAEERVADVIGF